MNKYREIIWDECNKANNFLHIPGFYRHFKEWTEKGEDMIYAISHISCPISVSEFNKKQETCKKLYFTHTEKAFNVTVLQDKDKYYHMDFIEEDKLVIYTAMYGERISYARPLQMFLSKVDKEKYPNAKQKFRFERIQ